jgi:hypothetical protein
LGDVTELSMARRRLLLNNKGRTDHQPDPQPLRGGRLRPAPEHRPQERLDCPLGVRRSVPHRERHRIRGAAEVDAAPKATPPVGLGEAEAAEEHAADCRHTEDGGDAQEAANSLR